MNLIVDMITYEDAARAEDLVEKLGGIVEAAAFSDPKKNTVRIASNIRSMEPHTDVYNNLERDISMLAKVRWFNSVIRHMSIELCCYDCWIALRIANSVFQAMTNVKQDVDVESTWKKLSNFSTTANVTPDASSAAAQQERDAPS